jgi:3-deoxy-manno-octulosonate cytidylyltransferase (CMP-KDO synthetase)
MGSTRFPGKPLADILGLPMIEHVRRRTTLSPLLDEVIVATCDQEIYDAVMGFGGKAVMTADSHERCTDRIAEAARILELDVDVIVNVQGDEPLFHPEQIEELLAPYEKDPDLPCTNLMAEITSQNDFASTDVVKTVCLPSGDALYFSREPIPSRSHCKFAYIPHKQLGVISFKVDFLQIFTALPPTPLEEIESVDMLRAVEHGYSVRMATTRFPSIGVDTPEGLERAARLMSEDELFSTYRNG